MNLTEMTQLQSKYFDFISFQIIAHNELLKQVSLTQNKSSFKLTAESSVRSAKQKHDHQAPGEALTNNNLGLKNETHKQI